MNYTELSTAIQDYLETTESSFVTHIPDFVRQAEERINRAVLIPDLRKDATGNLTGSANTLAKPSDFLSVSSFEVTNGSSVVFSLLPKERSFISAAYPTGTEGLPKYYADYGATNLILGPTPDTTYAYTLRYFYDPTSIVAAATSWLGDNAESVLLSACLVEGYKYLKGSADLMAVYQEGYETALNDLVLLGKVRKRTDENRNPGAINA